MNRYYEALLVLNTQAKEENVKEMIERLESEFQKEGARVEQVHKMEFLHTLYAELHRLEAVSHGDPAEVGQGEGQTACLTARAEVCRALLERRDGTVVVALNEGDPSIAVQGLRAY